MKAIEAVLNTHGFAATRPIAYTDMPCFSGRICIDTWKLDVELRFLESKYDYPVAYLPEWPHNMEMRAAFGFRNINEAGKICYVDVSRTWWDSAKAPEFVVGALRSIEDLLLGNLGGLPAKEAVARDFNGYWSSNKTLYVADTAQNRGVFHQVCEKGIGRGWLIPKDKEPWIIIDVASSPQTTWLVIHLKEPASILTTEVWPPATVTSLFEWIDLNSPNITTRLVNALRQSVFKRGKKEQQGYRKCVGFILTWPDENRVAKLGCGFTFVVSNVVGLAISHDRLRDAATILKNESKELVRYTLLRADGHYIQNRNTPDASASLKNKRVILVGGGTIGGYLAKLLCSYGAGWGSKGNFHIVDPDTFSVENTGRHLLGLESLEMNKAISLKAHLKASFPHLKIESHARSITKSWQLITNDSIVIDATGSQTVSIAVSDYLSGRKDLKPVLLHSWVHGHGAATVALLNDRTERKSACFRCLWQIENDTYKPKYVLSRTPEQDAPVFAGCHHSFHPYAATISMVAATQP